MSDKLTRSEQVPAQPITGAQSQAPHPEPASPAGPKYVCELCGFEDTKELRDGVNNHWRKGYVAGARPRSEDAICYGHTKLVSPAGLSAVDPFNCPKCGAHDYGLHAPHCPHCMSSAVKELKAHAKSEGRFNAVAYSHAEELDQLRKYVRENRS